MGTNYQKDQAMCRSLELSTPPPHPLGRGEELEIEPMIYYVYVIKHHTSSKVQGSQNFWVAEHMEVLEDWHAQKGIEALYLFPIPCAVYLFIIPYIIS